jgi:hypothetical protein
MLWWEKVGSYPVFIVQACTLTSATGSRNFRHGTSALSSRNCCANARTSKPAFLANTYSRHRIPKLTSA